MLLSQDRLPAPQLRPLHVKRLVVSEAILFEMFRRGIRASHVFKDPVPADGNIVYCRWGGNPAVLVLWIESAEFPAIYGGEIIPELIPEFEAHPFASDD